MFSDKNKLFDKKKYGDLATLAQLLNTTPQNANNILKREKSKRHSEAIALLEKIINTREMLLNNQ